MKLWLGVDPQAFSDFVGVGVYQHRVIVTPPSMLVQHLRKCLR